MATENAEPAAQAVDWEACKENSMPAKSGRKAAALGGNYQATLGLVMGRAQAASRMATRGYLDSDEDDSSYREASEGPGVGEGSFDYS